MCQNYETSNLFMFCIKTFSVAKLQNEWIFLIERWELNSQNFINSWKFYEVVENFKFLECDFFGKYFLYLSHFIIEIFFPGHKNHQLFSPVRKNGPKFETKVAEYYPLSLYFLWQFLMTPMKFLGRTAHELIFLFANWNSQTHSTVPHYLLLIVVSFLFDNVQSFIHGWLIYDSGVLRSDLALFVVSNKPTTGFVCYIEWISGFSVAKLSPNDDTIGFYKFHR
jgi:hypothetical protein